MELLDIARDVLQKEAQAILALVDQLDERFTEAVDILYNCTGRVVVTGMGKSGLICKKIAATLASTGTPALFLHPAEAIHGDLGMVVRGDVVLAASNSGETEEINRLLPIIKRFGVKLISMTGNLKSVLAQNSDVVLNISVAEEACPLGLAPTCSTTVTLALGDALAVALIKRRGFQEDDFAALHPGGRLGRRLLKVEDMMHVGVDIPVITEETPMKMAILEMTSKKMGVTSVVDNNARLTGVITDGDLRRLVERDTNFINRPARECMTRNPKVISKTELAEKALQIMEKYTITSLFVLDKRQHPYGIIHMHDLLKAGVV